MLNIYIMRMKNKINYIYLYAKPSTEDKEAKNFILGEITAKANQNLPKYNGLKFSIN